MPDILGVVVSATIVPASGFGSKAKVLATVSDGEFETVDVPIVEYYDDELSFTAEEFIGLTMDEASEVFHKKDIAYLQS